MIRNLLHTIGLCLAVIMTALMVVWFVAALEDSFR